MLDITSLTFAYDEPEDRISLSCCCAGGERLTLWFTRRITQRLLAGFAQLLEQSSPIAAKAPADMRTEVMVLEHLGALDIAASPANDSAAATESADEEEAHTHLVSRVDIDITPTLFNLTLHSSAQPIARLSPNRNEFHRLLAGLDRYAAIAEWDLRENTRWLAQTAETLKTPSYREIS